MNKEINKEDVRKMSDSWNSTSTDDFGNLRKGLIVTEFIEKRLTIITKSDITASIRLMQISIH